MEHVALLGTVIGIHLLALISPGPDFVMAVRNSLKYSRKIGLWTAAGFGAGVSIHIIYCLAGLALVISQSILIFNIIKFLGAGYLIYIGIKSCLSKKSKDVSIEMPQEKVSDISRWAAFRQGFLTNLLNPKATLFFLSLFTLVIDPTTSHSLTILMSIIMIANTVIWFSLVTFLFTQPKVRIVFQKYQHIFNRVFGAALIALGIKVAFTHR